MKITVVIVTYNRKEHLEQVLKIYDEIKYKIENLIVVNNCSSDGTYELLQNWKNEKSKYKKILINMDKNLGGSGGFYEGMKKSLELGSEWVYISDDDAYPNKNIFEVFNEFAQNNDTKEIAALCSKVINNGKIDISHRRRIEAKKMFIKEENVSESEYNDNFELHLFSYVGTLINLKYIKKYGITEKDYFIYCDDTEHSLRLSKYGKIICIPKAEVIHNVSNEENGILTWKHYYGERNNLLTIKKHYGNRYFINEYLKSKLRVIKRLCVGKFKEAKVINKAIEDARKNKQGIDPIYKPGWSINK